MEYVPRHQPDELTTFAVRNDLSVWEAWFSPYADEIYAEVLAHVRAEDVVYEIGAGDLRLALRLARKARRVYAVEVNPRVLGPALEQLGFDLPRNLVVTCGNALDLPVPPEVTTAVLLMRHCTHFAHYFDLLQRAGCRLLITNARWHCGVEVIDLAAPRRPFQSVREGWYACRCGAVGYVGCGDAVDAPPIEVATCPQCDGGEDAFAG